MTDSIFHRAHDFVGTTAAWFPNRKRKDLVVFVKIENHRVVYGRPEFYIEPLAGSGGTWVQGYTLEIREGY